MERLGGPQGRLDTQEPCAAWTDGIAHLVLFRNGTLSLYKGARLAWFWPGGNRETEAPANILRFRELAGWPEDAMEVAGPYALIQGPGALALEKLRPERDLLELELPSGVRLCTSPAGTALSDRETGELRCLEDGARVSVEGPLWDLLGARVEGGFVALIRRERTELVRLDDAGVPTASQRVADARLLWIFEDIVLAVTSTGATWDSFRLQGFDLRTLEPLPRCHLALSELNGERCELSFVGATGLILDGERAWLVDISEGRPRKVASFPVPSGDPTSLAGPTRLSPQTLSWRGPPGPFRVEGELCNEGQSATGLRLRAQPRGSVRLERATLGAPPQDGIPAEGGFDFPFSRLAHAAPVPLVIQGMVFGSVALDLEIEHDKRTVGVVHLELEAAGGLRCERGEEALPFELSWLDALRAVGALDLSAPAPDLERWRVRAATRGRGDPARTEEAFLELSAADRAREHPPLVPAFKFTPGGPWQITHDEALVIAARLGPDHPLGRFARKGPFLVRSS